MIVPYEKRHSYLIYIDNFEHEHVYAYEYKNRPKPFFLHIRP